MKIFKIFLLSIFTLLASTNTAFSQAEEVTQESSKATASTIKVKGITCSSDLKTISTNVEKLNGVSSCKTLKDGATATFEVNYNPEVVSKEDIYAAIENTGGCKNPNDRPYKVKGK